MTKVPLSLTITIAVATAFGFVGGYLFHLGFGTELPAARQALVEMRSSERVLDAYRAILEAEAMHKALTTEKSMEEMRQIRARSKTVVLESVDRFIQISSGAQDRREKLLAEAFLPGAMKIREAVTAAP